MRNKEEKLVWNMFNICFPKVPSRGAPEEFSLSPKGTAFKDLVMRYDGADRFYHSLNHIYTMLCNLYNLRKEEFFDEPDLVLAIIYHDVIYTSGALDNELQSTRLLQEHTKGSNELKLITDVTRLILATTDHKPTIAPDDPLAIQEKTIIDLDLMPLGVSWEAFMVGRENVRKEYPQYDDETFAARSKAFFSKFLERDRIYYTDQVFETYEAQARENLSKFVL